VNVKTIWHNLNDPTKQRLMTCFALIDMTTKKHFFTLFCQVRAKQKAFFEINKISLLAI
jgi:hypothetical protein